MNQRQHNKPHTPKELIKIIRRKFSINNRAQADSYSYHVFLKKVSKKMVREIEMQGYRVEVVKRNDRRFVLKVIGRKSVKMDVLS
ncbi:hypothetical protein GCM10017764_17740 [Sphingobacterium griseoflavum]|uniref:Uncharacterized protein n=1 Tax=Sphingobacterium griseoflavum TaxID=1474952 RepID=A0ABQ3HU49_9SPHI|nr:hypothetical protein GCM10017764_17740 [Sphingobacterium griseoflavum]